VKKLSPIQSVLLQKFVQVCVCSVISQTKTVNHLSYLDEMDHLAIPRYLTMERRILLYLLVQIHLIQSKTTCPPGFFQFTQVKCNLWDATASQVPYSVASISSTRGEFASHFSPPGSRCELLIVNVSSEKHLEISINSAYIDAASSLSFLACRSSEVCNPEPVLAWSGVAWNVQGFPMQENRYRFSIPMQYANLKIVLQVSAFPIASNTFAVSWDSGQSCKPCLQSIPQQFDSLDAWTPYISIAGCEMHSKGYWVV
jgi:hypothetical protein